MDCWHIAEPYIEVEGSNGKIWTMSEASINYDPVAHLKLTDDFVDVNIRHSTKKELEPARKILERWPLKY